MPESNARLALATAVTCVLLCISMREARSADDSSANAQTPSDVGQSASSDASPSETDFSPGGWLTAFHKERQKLKDIGIDFKVHEESELWGNAVGGGRQGVSYNGLTTVKLDVDLDKLAGWAGAEFLSRTFDIHAHGPSRSFLGNLQLVSNIEATPSIKAYDALARPEPV